MNVFLILKLPDPNDAPPSDSGEVKESIVDGKLGPGAEDSFKPSGECGGPACCKSFPKVCTTLRGLVPMLGEHASMDRHMSLDSDSKHTFAGVAT